MDVESTTASGNGSESSPAVIAAPWDPVGTRVVGLRLESLRLAVSDGVTQTAIREQIEFLGALHGYAHVTFCLQYLVDPTAPRAEDQLQIDLIAATADEAGPRSKEDMQELVEDLEDLLQSHDRWYRFQRIVDDDALVHALSPFEISAAIEVLRREEPVGTALLRRGVGFGTNLTVEEVQQLSTFSAFQLTDDPRSDLIALLMAQDHPVVFRVTATPTSLSPEERLALGSLDRHWPAPSGPGTLDDVARRSLQAMAFVDPNFEVAVTIAGDQRLSPTLVESVGIAISPPQSPTAAATSISGGYELAPITDTERSGSALELRSDDAGWLAPPPLRRLRRVMGPWELAAAFRIPVAQDAHFPGMTVRRTPALRVAPNGLPTEGTAIGSVEADNIPLSVRLSESDRFRHTYILGQTGTGKSTLLLNMILQDIGRGAGVAVIDPHGDLAESVLERVPEDRLDDVVLVDPADPEAVVGINLLEADSPVQTDYLVSDLCEFFQQLFDPKQQGIVGPRFQAWLRNACLTLIPVPGQGTICDVPRLFLDNDYLKFCFRYVSDPLVRDFWIKEMGQTSDYHKSEMLGWFSSKFDPFRASRLTRHTLGQPFSTISFRDVMDKQQILIVKLSKGLMGESNTSLMGYVVFSKLWAAALSRAELDESRRLPFHVYVDEFQNMTSPALPTILSEARKFGISLTLANQFFAQVDADLREAIVGNVGSKLVFRLGANDAEAFASTLGGSSITADHLRRLPNYLLVADLLVNGEPRDPMLVSTSAPSIGDPARGTEARRRSRSRYATNHTTIEDLLSRLHHNYDPNAPTTSPEPT